MRFTWRWLVVVTFAWLSGCKTQPSAPGVEDDYRGTAMTCVDHDGDGYGFGCALGLDCDDNNATVTNQCRVCAHDQPGCPCHSEGARSACGKVTARIGDQTTCGYGSSVCWNGTWGECSLDGNSTRSFTSTSAHELGLAPATDCGTICDPYCKQYPDTPDNSLTTHTGIVGTDAGLTLELVEGGATSNPNGPMPDGIKNQLTDAGLYPDAAPDAIIYHELVPAATAEDTVAATTNVNAIDVYFVDYTKGVRGAAQRTLWYDLDVPGAAMDAVRAHVPDAWFGAGRYDQYDQPAWNGTPYHTFAYQHVLSMTNVLGNVSRGIDWIDGRFNDTGFETTSWVEALFAMATSNGLPRDIGAPWVPPRSTWSTPASTLTESGPCPLGRVGYPCFRPWALPVTVLFSQSPSDNGPGGQYAYSRNPTDGIGGAARWPATSTAVTGNYTEATAQALDPVGAFATYTGSTTMGLANQSWIFPAFDSCDTGEGGAEPNVFFKLHANARTWYHFDTVGSSFDTLLYMYSAAGQPVACSDRHFMAYAPTPMPASIDGVVDAGDYFVVIDGHDGSSGNYVLHVNAMPDGAAAGPVAEPSYEEAVAAMNRIGAKVVSVDSSNYTCRGLGASIQRNTGNQLERLGIDTGSVDATGAPYRVVIDPDNGPCHTGDVAIATQLGSAINGLFDGIANGRMDVSAVAVDVDDPIDFDGPPGGANILTPTNIDDATFVQSMTPVSTPETNARCQQALADRFVGCLPGTNVTFRVTFRIPPTVSLLPHEQIFSFVIRTVRGGTLVLGERPVVIVVPASGSLQYADSWFIRDYDTTSACPKGTAPLWGFFTWTAQTPADSRIDFEVAVAPSVAELSSSPFDALLFSDPPGPSGLAGQPVGAAEHMGDYNTQAGGALVDSTLLLNMRARDSRAMRLRAHLVPSPDRAVPPVLELWTQTISCQPAE